MYNVQTSEFLHITVWSLNIPAPSLSQLARNVLRYGDNVWLSVSYKRFWFHEIMLLVHRRSSQSILYIYIHSCFFLVFALNYPFVPFDQDTFSAPVIVQTNMGHKLKVSTCAWPSKYVIPLLLHVWHIKRQKHRPVSGHFLNTDHLKRNIYELLFFLKNGFIYWVILFLKKSTSRSRNVSNGEVDVEEKGHW